MSTNIHEITIEKGAGFSKDNKDIKLLETANTTTLNCPAPILNAFRNILEGSAVLGAYFKNPYTGKIEQFPKDHNQLTARDLQILARNEQFNTSGVMDTALYNGLLTDDQIARIRCLVKATLVGGLTQAHHTGGYKSERVEIPPTNTIVIDQSGLQWQGDFRNTGGMFFYPDSPNNQLLPTKYAQWQSDMHQVMYGIDRPKKADDFIHVTWKGVEGKVNLQGVANAIETEYRQALDAVVEQGKYLGENEKINFKFLKAGMGFFADGLGLYGPSQEKLEMARLKGIEQALKRIADLPVEEQKALLGKVGRLELPFSKLESIEGIRILENIQAQAEKMGLVWGGAEFEDALALRAGYVNATTNCGDPHAPIKNEGSKLTNKQDPSLDPSIGVNTYVDGHNPAINDQMRVRVSPSCHYEIIVIPSAQDNPIEKIQFNNLPLPDRLHARRGRPVQGERLAGGKWPDIPKYEQLEPQQKPESLFDRLMKAVDTFIESLSTAVAKVSKWLEEQNENKGPRL